MLREVLAVLQAWARKKAWVNTPVKRALLTGSCTNVRSFGIAFSTLLQCNHHMTARVMMEKLRQLGH